MRRWRRIHLRLKGRSLPRGVKLTDVKLRLPSHAHFDHYGELSALKKATGARLAVGSEDASAVPMGTPSGETDYGVIRLPVVPVDLAIKDGGEATLGGVTLTAVSTAGHTPGCTSWRMSVPHQGWTLDVLFACSTTVAGNKLVANGRYPSIVEDFRRSFARLETLTPDVVLTFHPDSAELRSRAASNAVVDRTAFRKMMANRRAAFEAELKRQQRQ